MNASLLSKICNRSAVALAFILLLLSGDSWAQDQKSDSVKFRKNIIRFNLSNFMLFGSKNIIFGYERVVSPNQSFSINIGHAELPKMVSINTDSFNITRQSSRTGFNISADYRFYLKKENKYRAPRGVYIGPYLMYNQMRSNTTWEFETNNSTEQIEAQSDFKIFGGGVQLGYQFIIKKRIALDLVLIGPGIANYSLDVKLDGTISAEDREQLISALQQALQNKYPGMDLIFGEKEISSDGRLGALSGGFRYLIHIGFLF